MRKIAYALLFLLGFLEPSYAHKTLSFYNTHTHEKFKGVYQTKKGHDAKVLKGIEHILRDHRTNGVHNIDIDLLDYLWELAKKINAKHPETVNFHVISGYRSPQTNNMLCEKNGGSVSKNSLHKEGRAIDIRVPGIPIRQLRDAALSLKRGGVGCYPESDFVHIDTGRVRRWGTLD